MKDVQTPARTDPHQSPVARSLSIALTVVRRVVDVVAIALLCAMVLLVLSQVFGRYVFNYAISWSEESATFTQVWLVMLGAGIAMRNRQHVGIDFLVARCPALVQRVVTGAGFLLAAWFIVAVIVGSLSMLSIGMMVRSPALQLPLAVPYAALPIGMAYFLLELAMATLPTVFSSDRTQIASSREVE